MDENLIVLIIVAISIASFIIFVFIAPIWEFKSCITEKKVEVYNKLLWMMFMIFFWPIGQITFACKRKHIALVITFLISGLTWLTTMTYLLYTKRDAILAAINS